MPISEIYQMDMPKYFMVGQIFTHGNWRNAV